jgi:hypothetical protein
MDERFVRSAKNGKKRSGKTQLLKHLHGKMLTRNQAINAKCYDCNGMGESNTCEINECSLISYSPYRIKGSSSQKRHFLKGRNESESIVAEVDNA